MALSHISNIMLKNWDVAFKDFGVSVQTLANKEAVWHVYKPYFFLRKELAIMPEDWKDAKAHGEIRHCILNKGKFFDYVVDKKFDTFEEWLADAGGTMSDVLYGVNRIHKLICTAWDHTTMKFVYEPDKAMYVELRVLHTYLEDREYFEPERDNDGYFIRISRAVLDDWEENGDRIGSTVIH